MKTQRLLLAKTILPKAMLVLATCLNSLTVQAACSEAITPTAALNHFRVLDSANEVQDLRTGLIWQRCVVGTSFNKNTAFCSGSGSRYDWQGALQQAEQAASSSGLTWRLPSVKELNSIMEHACRPRTNSLFSFPAPIWSATPSAGFGNSGSSYVVDFNSGAQIRSRDVDNMYSVILVRSGTPANTQVPVQP